MPGDGLSVRHPGPSHRFTKSPKVPKKAMTVRGISTFPGGNGFIRHGRKSGADVLVRLVVNGLIDYYQ